MGKGLLIIATGLLVASGVMLFSGPQKHIDEAERTLGEYGSRTVAREAAVTGYNLAKQRIVAGEVDEDGTAISGEYDGNSTFDVTVDYSVGSAETESTEDGAGTSVGVFEVVVTGRSPLPAGEFAEHRVHASFGRSSASSTRDADHELPAFLDYAVLTDGDLVLNGNVFVGPDTQLPDFPETVTVRANGSIPSSPSKVIPASAMYAGERGPDESKFMGGVQDGVGKIEIPDFDPEDFKSTADQVLPGIACSGSSSCASFYARNEVDESGNAYSASNPFVVYVEGDMEFRGQGNRDTHIQPNTVFIVEGDVTFTGNSNVVSNTVSGNGNNKELDYTPGNEGFVLFVGGDATLNLSGNALIEARIFAADGVITEMGGTPYIYGQLISGDHVTLHGNPEIYHRPMPPSFSIFDPETSIQLLDYSEHAK